MRKHLSLFLTASSLLLTQGAMASYLEQSNDIIMIDLGLSSQGATSSTAGSLTNSVVNGIENLGITASSAGSNLVNILNQSQGHDTITVPVLGNSVATSQTQFVVNQLAQPMIIENVPASAAPVSDDALFIADVEDALNAARTPAEVAAIRSSAVTQYTTHFGNSGRVLTWPFQPTAGSLTNSVVNGIENLGITASSAGSNLVNILNQSQGHDTITVPVLGNSVATSQTQFVTNQLAQPMIIENVPARNVPASDEEIFIADVENDLNSARTPAEVAAIRSSAVTQYTTHFGNSGRVLTWPFQPRD